LFRFCLSPNTVLRKLASLTIGNCAYHDSILYEDIEPGVHLIIKLLSDKDKKIRKNALGAISNFEKKLLYKLI